jgi:hypothetical protein
LTYGTQARADRRVLLSAALIGSGVGLALGAVYMAGGMARAATDHTRAERVAQVAAGQFSESVLQREAADPVVLRIAQAHDPEAGDDDTADRQLQALTQRLQAKEAHPEAMQAARDLDCLTDAVYYEARGEDKRGQQAVATVVLNRVKNPSFPKSVCGVVFQRASGGCQFSFACDGSMHHGRRETDAWDDARHIAARALSGYVLRDVGSATHFHTIDVAPEWGPKMLRVAQIGLHVFYRFNPHARDVSPTAAPEPQHAVFVSAPAGEAPTLRLAAALVQKPDAQTPPAPAAAKAVAELPKAAPAGLSKAVEPELKSQKTAETSAS